MTEREKLNVPSPGGGWPPPWPRVAELARVIGPEHWTLVGGLMVQLHAFAAGITSVRPTEDVDIVVHIETGRGRVADVVAALEGLGYELHPSIDDRNRFAHRFVRGADSIDLSEAEQIDVVAADHAAPTVVEKLKGYDMVTIEGGTQALKRTVDATLDVDGESITVSVPSAYGGLILKSAAHLTDSRDKGRHLADAVTLLACIDDPFAVSEMQVFGSDDKRIRHLIDALSADPVHWMGRPAAERDRARAALKIFARSVSERHSSPG